MQIDKNVNVNVNVFKLEWYYAAVSTSKILGKINRIKDGVAKALRKEHAGFRHQEEQQTKYYPRNIFEQYVVWKTALYIDFIDLKKTFDTSRHLFGKQWISINNHQSLYQ